MRARWLAVMIGGLLLAPPAAAGARQVHWTLSPFAEGAPAAALTGVREAEGPEELGLEASEHASSAQAIADVIGGAPGGPGVAHRAGGRPEPAPPYAVSAGERFDTGNTAGEPTLGITRDGTIFFVGIAFNAAGSARSIIQRSRDRGRTWEELTPLGPQKDAQQSLDPFLYVDTTTDRLFNVDLLPPCTPVSYSDDEGDAFTQGVVCNHTDHQNLFAGPAPDGGQQPSGYPNVLYYCAIDGGALFALGTVTGCSRSLDGGATFRRTSGNPFVPNPSLPESDHGIPGDCGGATGHGWVDRKGTVYVPRGWCGQPYVAISHDEGATWEQVQVADLGMPLAGDVWEHEAGIASDPSGTLYYFWVANDRKPYLATSRDGGKTWARPLMVAPPGVVETQHPAVIAGEDGRVAMVYMGSANSPGGPFCVHTSPGGCTRADGSGPRPDSDYSEARWNGYVTMTVDALAPDPVFYTGTVNAAADPLVVGTCGPGRCQQAFDFLDIVVGPDGSPYASFVDACPGDAETPGDCLDVVGAGLVGRLAGGPPLTGALPPVAPAPAPVPSHRPCRTPRVRTIKLRVPRGKRVRKVTAKLDRRRVRVRRRGRTIRVRVDLRRHARGTAVLVIDVRLTTGRHIRTIRRLTVC